MSNMMSPKDLEDIKNGNVPSTHYQDNTEYQPKQKVEQGVSITEHLCKKCINKYQCYWYKDYGPSKLLLACNARITEE